MSENKKPLKIYVNDDLMLDAGWWEEIRELGGEIRRIVYPPERPMFDQVVNYLASLTEPLDQTDITLGDETFALITVCLRWGSYLSVLADINKPRYKAPHGRKSSQIDDTEMARINIEASAALERWIDIMRNEPEQYRLLVNAAHRLPLPITQELKPHIKTLALFHALADPRIAKFLPPYTNWDKDESLNRIWAEVKKYPTRVLANAIIYYCWRNGPIEKIHGNQVLDTGDIQFSTYPILQRRITPSEEKGLLLTAARHFAGAVEAVHKLISDNSERTWAERILPFNIDSMIGINLRSWSLTDSSRKVILYGSEPKLKLNRKALAKEQS